MASPHDGFLRLAIDEALRGLAAGRGGPFGAVVVRDGAVVAAASNTVLADNDPTAHAEVQAIRAACSALGTFQLAGCDVYASCEPCPMCLGALYWARPRAVYYAATRAQAAAAGFDDAFIYDQLARPTEARALAIARLPVDGADRPFAAWLASPARVRY